MRGIKTVVVQSFLLFWIITAVFTDFSRAQPLPLEWYYDNLTTEDRQKIRQAMDYAIPRLQIIEKYLKGYAVPIATPIGPKNFDLWDSTIEPRPYDPNKALTLLTEVFNKTYNMEAENETFTTEPYFTMGLIAPNIDTEKTKWITSISKSFQNIGIDVHLKFWKWDVLIPRIFTDLQYTGHDWVHAGYDAHFFDWFKNPDPDYSNMFLSRSFVPNGDNSAWINNSDVEEIWDRALFLQSLGGRTEALKDFQKWFHKEVPMSIIYQGRNVFVIDKHLKGFDPYLINNYNNWTLPGQDSVTITIPGEFVDFNPILSNSYYDHLALGAIHGSLTKRRGVYNLTHAIGYLADSWNQTKDHLKWTVKLKQGIKWHDFETSDKYVTADDVVFSYRSALNESIGAAARGMLLTILEKPSNIQKIDDHTVMFTLPRYYPFVTTVLFNLPILAKHQMERIPIKNWRTDETNTKTTPVGFGPYMFDEFDGIHSITLKKSDLYNGTLMGHNPTAEGGGVFFQNGEIDKIHFKIVKDGSLAVTGLKDGDYDVIDYHTSIYAMIEEINQSDWGKLVINQDWGWHGLTYNQFSPIWGMNPGDPREMYPEISHNHDIFPGLEFSLIGIAILISILTKQRFNK